MAEQVQQPQVLSKTLFMALHQCQRRPWLEIFRPELKEDPDIVAQLNIEEGIAIGELARQLFPRGRLVPREDCTHEKAVDITKRLLEDPSVDAVFEAAFENIPIRVDILKKLDDGTYQLIEVKGNTGEDDKKRQMRVPQEHDIVDAAYQYYALKSAGVPVSSVIVMFVNNQYERTEEIDLEDYFLKYDATGEAEAMADEIRAMLEVGHEILQQEQMPQVDLGSQCNKPVTCPFKGACRDMLPEYHVVDLPFPSNKLRARLKEAGIELIEDLRPNDRPGAPADTVQEEFELSTNQDRFARVVAKNIIARERDERGRLVAKLRDPVIPFVDVDGFRRAVAPLLEGPSYWLDFETIQVAHPKKLFPRKVLSLADILVEQDGEVRYRYRGTRHIPGERPYRHRVTQFSCHFFDPDNTTLTHTEYIHATPIDGRLEMLERILEATMGPYPIVVYNKTYEIKQLENFKEDFPAYAEDIDDRISRVFDLLPPVRHCWLDPRAERGSSSLKVASKYMLEWARRHEHPDRPSFFSTLPSYDELNVKDGSYAIQATLELYDPMTTEERRRRIIQDLLTYCGLDTKIMLYMVAAMVPEFREKLEIAVQREQELQLQQAQPLVAEKPRLKTVPR